MKKVVLLCFLIIMGLSPLFGNNTYYVALHGSDSKDGSELKPWRTLDHAFRHLSEGVVLVLDDGVFRINKALEIDGIHSKGKGIVIKAKNKGKTTLLFDGDIVKDTKLSIRNSSNIILDGLIFRSTRKRNNNTGDILLAVRSSSNISIINNEFSHVFEEGLKVSKAKNILVENNLFHDFDHEGVDFLDVSNSVIRNNTFNEIGRVGIMVKGGSNDILVLNNLIENTSTMMKTAGITIGGMTIHSSARNFKRGAYEATNVIAANNKIIAHGNGSINNGVAFYGANRSYLVNTEIGGASVGILFKQNSSTSYGWEEDVNNSEIRLINNHVFNAVKKDIEVLNKPKNIFVNEVLLENRTNLQLKISNTNRVPLDKRVRINGKRLRLSNIVTNQTIGRIR